MAKRLVHVVKADSNAIVHSQTVILNSLNDAVTTEEFEDIAWKTAVDDGDVPVGAKQSDYKFKIEMPKNP